MIQQLRLHKEPRAAAAPFPSILISPKYFKPVLDKTTSGSESTIQVSSREPGPLSSEQVQLYPGVHSSPSSFSNCNTQIHLICLSFQAFQQHYSASFKVYHIIFEPAIILFPVLQSPADQGKFTLFPVVTTSNCDHLLLDPIRCKKAPTVKAWSLLLSLMVCVIAAGPISGENYMTSSPNTRRKNHCEQPILEISKQYEILNHTCHSENSAAAPTDQDTPEERGLIKLRIK